MQLNFTEDRFPIHLFPFVNFSNDLAPFHKPVTAKSQERNTYNVAVFITFHGKTQRKSQDCVRLQQWAISHVIQIDCNRYPVDNEYVLTLLRQQKTMNWKDMALWFCQRQCMMYLLPYYESNQKEIGSEEIRSGHLCHSW